MNNLLICQSKAVYLSNKILLICQMEIANLSDR